MSQMFLLSREDLQQIAHDTAEELRPVFEAFRDLAEATLSDLGSSPACREKAQAALIVARATVQKWSNNDERTN